MPVPFILLIVAILTVWAPLLRLRDGLALPPWVVAYGAALVMAFLDGYVGVLGVIALITMAGLAESLRRPLRPVIDWSLFALLLLLAAALTLHRIPGFNNPIAIDAVRFSEDARPFTQYLNFDKGSVGLILLATLAPRLRSGDAVGATLLRAVALAVVVSAVALGAAFAAGMVHLDPKWPTQTVQFLAANLFLTCVAEEALFRVLVQDRLSGVRSGAGGATLASDALRARSVLAVVLSAALFGAVHAGGGAWMVAVAGLAGLGYAAAYAWYRRIEVPIVVHFGVNAVHFLLFTYPALRG